MSKPVSLLSHAELSTVAGGYWGQSVVNKVKETAGNVARKADDVVGKIPGGKFIAKKAGPVGALYGAFSAGQEWEHREGESTFDRARHALGAAIL